MIAAVVVTHSAPAGVLESCVTAVRGAGGIDIVIVVDNGERACTIEAGAGLEVVRTVNRGYGAAANVGFARARALGAGTVALLNDDVVVRAGWVEPLVKAVGQPRVGAAQPKLLTAGTDPPRINSMGVEIGRDGAGRDIARDALDVVSAVPSPIEYFTGGAVMMSSAFLADTGGFDTRWFLYYEDIDLAARGAARGWHYQLVPSSVVEHAGGVTTSTLPRRTLYLQERNRLWFAFRHAGAATVARALWLSVRRLRHRPRGLHGRALLAGIAGAPGALWRRSRHR